MEVIADSMYTRDVYKKWEVIVVKSESVVVPFRLNPCELVTLKQAAEIEKVSVAAWVAREVRNGLRRAKRRFNSNRVPSFPVEPESPRVSRPRVELVPSAARPAIPGVVSTGSPGLGSATKPYGLCPCLSGLKWKFCGKLGKCH
jgi:hypothetical protein